MDRRPIGAILLLGLGLMAIVGIYLIRSLTPHSPQPSVMTTSSGETQEAKQKPEVVKPANAIAISIASSNTKEEWLHQATKNFNERSRTDADLQVDGHPIIVEILQETMVDGKKKDYRSGTMISDTMKEKIKPTILSPGEEVWLARFTSEYKTLHGSTPIRGESPIVVRTPIVVAMWQSRAKAFGCYPTVGPQCTWQKIFELASHSEGWKLFGKPEWKKFTFGYGYFGESNSGTLGITSMCMAGLKKTNGLTVADIEVDNGCGKLIGGIEMAKVHSGKDDRWLLDKMREGGPEYLDAVITYESNVIAINKKYGLSMPELLIAVPPQDGTIVVGNPFGILDGVPWVTPEQVLAAKKYQSYLLERDQQTMVLDVGLRPADSRIKLGPPIDAAFGANPNAKLVSLEAPDQSVLQRIGEVWHARKKRPSSCLCLINPTA